MKAKYPVEAYALAMVLSTRFLSTAVVDGVLILLGTLIGIVGRLIMGEEKRMQEVEIMTTFFTVFGFIYIVNTGVFHQTEDWQTMCAVAALALLTSKFVWQAEPELCVDYKTIITRSVAAYIAVIVIALVREVLGCGTILGNPVLDHAMVASGYTHTFFGFIMAGFGVAAVNRFFDIELEDIESALIIVPCAVIAAPFMIKGAPQALSTVLSAFLVVIYIVSVKGRLLFSDTQKSFSGMPVELIAVGIVYMILSFF